MIVIIWLMGMMSQVFCHNGTYGVAQEIEDIKNDCIDTIDCTNYGYVCANVRVTRNTTMIQGKMCIRDDLCGQTIEKNMTINERKNETEEEPPSRTREVPIEDRDIGDDGNSTASEDPVVEEEEPVILTELMVTKY